MLRTEKTAALFGTIIFDEKDCINEYMLSIFVKGDDNRYDKFT
ncbi:MAG: hypothetical protein ACLUR5_02000 [Eubacterium ventriosum]